MSSNQPKNISPGRHVNSRSASSPSARSSTNSIGSYETPPPTSRYAQYIYNSNPRRNNNNNNGGGNRQRRFGDGGPFIHLGEDDNSGLSSETIKKAFLNQKQLVAIAIAPVCLGLGSGLAIGLLGLIGCYKDNNVDRFSNIEFPDICIQAEQTLFVDDYQVWNIVYNIFSIFQTGALFGSILTLCLINVIGPKALCQLSSFALFLGSVIACISKEEMFILSIISKVSSSVGIGIAVICVPLYVVETSTVQTRGPISGLFQFFLFIGISVSLYLKYYMFYNSISQLQGDNDTNSSGDVLINEMPLIWLLALGLQSIPSFIALIFLCFIPESPRWLMKKGRFGEAGDALRRVRDQAEVVEAEILLMQDVIDNGNNEVIEEDLNFQTNLYRYFCQDFMKKNARVLFLTIMHCIIGIGVIAKFIPYILTKTIYPKSFIVTTSGSNHHPSSHNNNTHNGTKSKGNDNNNNDDSIKKEMLLFLYLLIITNLSMLVSICSTSRYKNRQRLLVCGSIGLSISGILLCVLELGYVSSEVSIIFPVYLIAIVLYVVSYSLTWGPIGWSLPLEYFDLLNRGFGFTMSWIISWIFSIGFSILSTYFEFVFKDFTKKFDGGTLAILLLYTVVNVIGTIIIIIFYREIPEDKVLEEIEQDYYNKLSDLHVQDLSGYQQQG